MDALLALVSGWRWHLVTAFGANSFNLDFERDFETPADIAGAVTFLPKLFDCFAITTNFDRVLERAYENDAKAFVEKVTGHRSQVAAKPTRSSAPFPPTSVSSSRAVPVLDCAA